MRSPPQPLPGAWPFSYPLHRPIVTSEARALDEAARRDFGIPDLLLMERAALGVACLVPPADRRASGPVLVLCGPGNNGGDGYAAARHLSGWGRAVRVLDLARVPPSGASARLQQSLCARVLPIESAWDRPELLSAALAEAAFVVDALFGVGLDRALDGPWCAAIECVNAAARPTLAVDVPSGLDADTGEARPVCVRADVTATMVAPKRGIAPGMPGADHAGRVVEIDIGLPWALHAPYLASP